MGLRRSKMFGATLAVLTMTATATACGGTAGVGSASDKDHTLILWHMEQPPNRVKGFQAIIDRYNATNPGYKVKQQVQDWNQIYTKIAGAVQSKTQPDILFTIPDFTTYVRPLGAVRPVTSFVAEMNKQHQFINAATAPYYDKEQYWAVPLYGMVQMLWYRKDLFTKAGISEPPNTWDEFLADTQRLTSGKQHGVALPAGKNLATDQVMYSLMLTNGAGNLFTPEGKISFDNPKTTQAFKFYDQLLKYSPSDSGNYSWGEPQAAFNSGAAAMAIEKGQFLTPFEQESGRPSGDLGCAPIPQPAGGQAGSIYYSNGAMVMSKDDARAKGAEAFLKFLLEPKNYGDFVNAEAGLFLPLTTDGANSTSWKNNTIIKKYSGCVNKMLEQSKSGALFGFVDGQYEASIGKISGQNVLAQVVQRMYGNGEAPASAVKWGAEQMQKAVSP